MGLRLVLKWDELKSLNSLINHNRDGRKGGRKGKGGERVFFFCLFFGEWGNNQYGYANPMILIFSSYGDGIT